MASQANKASKFFGTSPLETTKAQRNVAAKNAEDELLIYTGKSPYKNYLNRNDIILSINRFKKNYNRNNNRNNTFKTKYPKLSKWRQYHKDLEKLRKPGKDHLSTYGNYANNNNNSGNNNESNYINSVEGKINGINVKAVLKKTDQAPTLYNRFTKRFTTKKTANQYLPTQQNTPNNIRSAEAVQQVSTATPSKSSWWPFGGGRKTHRKPSGSRGGDPPGNSIAKYKLALAESEFKIAERDFLRMQKLYHINHNNRKIEQKMAAAAAKKATAQDNLERAKQNNKEAYAISLGRSLNNAAREAREAPRRSSWFSLGGGGRKSHHKKRHMRKGSRKTHRK